MSFIDYISVAVIKTSPKLAELMIFVMVNMCTHLRLNKQDILEMIHIVIFNSNSDTRLELHDFIRKSADKDEYVNLVSLVHIPLCMF